VERIRLRIADDLHDDVGSNLSSIAIVSRAVQRAPELTMTTKRKLAEIYETAISTSEGMKDIVWFIKPKNDTLDDLLLRMKDTASSLLSDVAHDFHAPKNESTTRIAIDFKRNFFLGFKEILTNIAKHASATNVHIHVKRHDDVLETIVQDNGHGFDPPKKDTVQRGNGLASLRTRARAIGGVCEISSQIGKGTTVRFSGRF
jgi:signal transduction histidine kinase